MFTGTVIPHAVTSVRQAGSAIQYTVKTGIGVHILEKEYECLYFSLPSLCKTEYPHV